MPSEIATPVLAEADWETMRQAALSHWRNEAKNLGGTHDACAFVEALSSASVESIRQIPAAARESLVLCGDADFPRVKLVGRLEKDPMLVQALLRTANSAGLAGSAKSIIRLDEALARLGLNITRSVILASCVEGLFSRPGEPFESMVGEIWRHMVRTGQIARAVAPCFGANSEEAFSVALLHDVGKLLVFDQISELRSKLRRQVVVPMPFLSALLQSVHEPFGALAALRWQMGPRASEAMGTHHRTDPTAAHDPLAETICAAERIDHLVRKGEPRVFEPMWQECRLSGQPAALSAIVDRMFPPQAA
jgi:HD-like signal output (HDOD) protein